MKKAINSLSSKTSEQSKLTKPKVLKLFSVFLASSILMACSDDKDVAKVAYEVEIVNLTNNQPFSPLALRAHGAAYSAWTVGESASLGIEYIAESGDNTEFLGTASSKKSASGTGIIAPGETAVIDLNSKVTDLYFTAVTMLVNTNDAFAGITGLNLSSLQIGDNTVVYLPIYDAGTEANNELAGTIPGPADGGTGFDAARDDVNFVAMHPGVVSVDDGYADSILEGSHKFDGPAAMLKITRIN
tara:strand:- start:61152 stop:61883 length:732 start_codon:yes stop_codon:yes gene_type:complete